MPLANLQEPPQLCIALCLLLQPLLRHGQMPDVRRVRQPKLDSGVEEDISYFLDDRCLLPLPDVKMLKQPPIALA